MAGRATGRPFFFSPEPDEPMSTKKNTKKPAEVEAVEESADTTPTVDEAAPVEESADTTPTVDEAAPVAEYDASRMITPQEACSYHAGDPES
jgi:hypothetical protein